MKNDGMMYSIVAMLLLLLTFQLSFTSTDFLVSENEYKIRKLLSDQVVRFEENMQSDIDKAIDVSARRAMVSAIDTVLQDGEPLDDTVLRIEELMRYGTIFGEEAGLMADNTLSDWLGKIVDNAEMSGYTVTMDYTTFSIELYDSFTVLFNVTIQINASDVYMTTNFTKSSVKRVYVPIEGFEDPAFPLNTLGRVKRVIRRSPYGYYGLKVASGTFGSGTATAVTIIANSSDTAYITSIPNKSAKILVTDNATNVEESLLSQFAGVVAETEDIPTITYLVGAEDARTTVPNSTSLYLDGPKKGAWDLNNLQQMVNQSYYEVSTTGASFFDRLEGRNSNTYGHGIESFVDLQELSDFELLIDPSKTCVDHLYFSDSPHPGSTIDGFYYTWFRIDSEDDGGQTHAEKYGVEELI